MNWQLSRPGPVCLPSSTKRSHRMMRKLLLATVAAVIATPAAAADNSPYVELDAGILFPQHVNGTYTSTYTQTVQSPAAGTPAAAPGTGAVGTLPTVFTTIPAATIGGSEARFKRGYDIDAIAGYDFGMFRLEGELGYKRANVKSFTQDTTFATGVTTALNPTGATQTTTFVYPTGNLSTFNLGNNVSVWSGMINGLLDFGNSNGLSFQVGAGIGRARVKTFDISDSAWAYQGIAGLRFALGGGLELGLKYKYFQTGRLNFAPGATAFSTTNTVVVPNVAAGAV